MAPKSAQKKEKPLWTSCPSCSLLIIGSGASDHLQNCENKAASYVDPSSCEFVTNRFEVRSEFAEEKTLPKSQLNGLVFLNINVMKVCRIVIGEFVLLETADGKQFVKRAWPVTDRAVEVVRLTQEELRRLDGAKRLKVKKVKEIREALEVKLRCENAKEMPPDLLTLLTLQLGKEFESHVCAKNDILQLRFLNKVFKFEISDVKSAVEDDLEATFEKLSLTDKFFMLSRNTTFIVEDLVQEVDIDSALKKRKIFIGGLESQAEEILKVIRSARNPSPNGGLIKGVILHGSSGCGKSLLIRHVLQQSQVPSISINGSEIFSRYYGETEANLSSIFAKVKGFTVIVIEDIHNLVPQADSSDIVRRVTAAFIEQLDRIQPWEALVLTTTSQIQSIHPNARRSGRLDYEIEVPVPNARTREAILTKILEKHETVLPLDDVRELAEVTHGYTGADLDSLVSKTFHLVRSDTITASDILRNLQIVKPSAMREVQIESPNIKWSDIGGQGELKLKLQQAIEWPIRHPEVFERLGITPPKGLLMFGPPGCSKTMIAKALATESGVNFLSIKGSELFSMWVGESEKAVQRVFSKAREVAPSIVFFDEIDAIGGERTSESGSVKERVLAQILTEIDGIHVLRDVTIVAATNRPDLIDKALMRPGRLDRVIFVGLPDTQTRREIFRIKIKKMPVAEDVSVDELVGRTEGYSGAEIQAVVQEAALSALERSFESETVALSDFEHALSLVKPRTSPELMKLYEDYLQKYRFK